MSSLETRLALSTCWNSHRHRDGYEMLTEIKDLGFSRVELSHGIRMDLVPGILKAIKEDMLTVGSTHNFCPLPSSAQGAAPNLFEPSTRRKREQILWRRYTERSIEFASQVGADMMVVHSGSVCFPFRSPRPALEREALTEPGAEKEAALEKLIQKSARSLSRLKGNFEALSECATRHGVRFGIENREDVLELPVDSKFPEFLEDWPVDSPFTYWHDTGHARIKERLGLLDHRTHLESLSARLAGFHLHDVDEDGKDHQEPGTGTIDFRMIRDFIRPAHLLVAELSPRLTRDEVLRSRDFLLETLA